MRLIDADKFLEWLDIGHLRQPSEICLSELNVKKMIELQSTINPETLPIVQELKKAVKKSCKTVKQQKKELDRRNKVIHELERQLAKVTAERDTMLKEFAGECGLCANYNKCKKYPAWCINGNRWKYRGLQE